MDFDKQYFEARAAAVAWLNKSPRHRSYALGLDILERMRYKPLLCRRLRMHQENSTLKKYLTQALSDGVNVYRNPTNKRHEDVVPAELEVMDAGIHQGVKEEVGTAATGESEIAIDKYPRNVQTIYRWFAKAYKERDRLHREMAGVGESNDTTSMSRRKELSDRINELSAWMDTLYHYREAYHDSGIIPTDEDMERLRQEKEVPPTTKTIPGEKESSLYKKNEDFATMGRDELAKRVRSLQTTLTRKRNQLLYQTDGKQDKSNPMPPCPKRTKLEAQVRILDEKLYQAKTALAKFG